MRDIIAALDKEQQKWAVEVRTQRERRAKECERFLKEAERMRKLTALSQEAHDVAANLAQELTDEGHSHVELPLPQEFTQALQNLMDEKAALKAARALERAARRADEWDMPETEKKAGAEDTGGTEGKACTEEKVINNKLVSKYIDKVIRNMNITNQYITNVTHTYPEGKQR